MSHIQRKALSNKYTSSFYQPLSLVMGLLTVLYYDVNLKEIEW